MASTISAGTTTTTALVYSADTSGVLQLQTNGTTTAVTIDTNQNFGLGVTPSAWSGVTAFQNKSASIAVTSNGNNMDLATNRYNNGTSDLFYQTGNYALMYEQASGSGAHRWFTSTATGTAGNAITFTQAMTLNSSGNLGIGTSSPSDLLSLSASNSSNTTGITLTNNNGTDQIGNSITFKGSFGAPFSADNLLARISSLVTSYTGGKYGNLTFSTGSGGSISEAMRIDSSNNLLVGYTSSNGSYKLQVNSQIFATSSTIATSDARYKENVEELSGALDIVKALRPVSFDWKAHPIHNFDTTTKTVGFLAQDVQQTLAGKPYLNSIIKTNECVIEPEVKDENGNVTKEAVTEEFLGIAEGNMISILTAAIQELSAQVTTLQTQVTALKG